MTFDLFVDIYGILASFIILLSLLMSAIKRLRILSLTGSLLMFAYGVMIASLPVVIMNVGIALVNIYHLSQIVRRRDYFDMIAVDKDDGYLEAFIDYYKKDVGQVLGENGLTESDYRFFILRDMVPAGLFIARKKDEASLEILLDYATPAYKDFKTGRFVFTKMAEQFKAAGYERFITRTENESHMSYLERMGFEAVHKEADHVTYVKRT